jgi:hypothetical protein
MSLLVGLPEVWWTSQEFSPACIIIIIIAMAVHVHISPAGSTIGPLVAAVQRHSPTPIIMFSQSKVVSPGVTTRISKCLSSRSLEPYPWHWTRKGAEGADA